VQNLVKNWEVEASFKPVLSDWRTIDHENYSFAINSSEPQGAENMLQVRPISPIHTHTPSSNLTRMCVQVGTYNAIISPNEFYDPTFSDFASSHKTFKRMMPTFAWEVVEVYSGPPVVAFRWRHWGVMKNDYVGINNRGEKVIAKAHGGVIDIQGVTVASVNGKVQLQGVRTWFDAMDMFRQIAPKGVVSKEEVEQGVRAEDVVESAQEGVRVPREQELPDATVQSEEEVRETIGEIEGREREEMPVEHPQVQEREGLGCPLGFR
jgi:hypothetical protein